MTTVRALAPALAPALAAAAATSLLTALLTALLAGIPRLALAAPAGPGRPVSCWTHGPTLAFGVYQPLAGTAALSDTTLQLSCTGTGSNVDYRLSLGAGPVSPSLLEQRMPRVLGGPSLMRFDVYVKPERIVLWGDGIQAGTGTFYGTATPGSRQNPHTVYGKIPAGQTHLQPGDYAVILPITVTFEP